MIRTTLCLDSESAHGKVCVFLLLLSCFGGLLLGAKLAADGAGTLDTEVGGDELLLAKERAQLDNDQE